MQCIVVCREHRTPQSESVGHLCAFIANNRSLCRKTCGLFWPISHANHPSASCLMLFESPLISFSSLFLLHICVNVTQSENASLQIKYFFSFLNDSPLCCECLGCFISLHAIHFGDRSLFFLWFCPFVNMRRDLNTFCAGSFLSVVHFSLLLSHTLELICSFIRLSCLYSLQKQTATAAAQSDQTIFACVI